MSSLINQYYQSIGSFRSLDLISVNSNVASFSSTTNQSLINFYTNLNSNNTYTLGYSNNSFILKHNNDNKGIVYNNDILNVDNVKSQNIEVDNINNNSIQLVYPNNNTPISAYRFSSSGSVGLNFASNVLDTNINSIWQSSSIFDNNGNLNYSLNLPQFNNLFVEPDSLDSFKYGVWVTIDFPLSIIIKSFKVSAVPFYLEFAPTQFFLYGYDYILQQWKFISQTTYFNWNASQTEVVINIDINKQILYDKIAFIVSKTNGGNYTFIHSLTFYGEPILSINNVRITKNEIFGVNSITVKELRLNSNSISSFDGLINTITRNSIISIQSNLSIDWSNLGSFRNTFTYKNVGINTLNPANSLDVLGSIQHYNRNIQYSISINPQPQTTINNITLPLIRYTSSYIRIGTFTFNTNEYISIDIYSIDIPINSIDYPFTNYSQKISLYGICNTSKTGNFYYDNEVNMSFLPLNNKFQKITDVCITYNQDNTIDFYVKYNDNLRITSFINPQNFSNVIYIDVKNTRGNINNNFTYPQGITYPLSGIIPTNCIKISENIIDNSINTLNRSNIFSSNILTNNLTINNIQLNNVLYNDINGNIKTTNVNLQQINKLNDISSNANFILSTDNSGLLNTTTVRPFLLNGLVNINNSNSFNRIPFINNSGLLDTTNITLQQLNRINDIQQNSNLVLIVNNQGLITASPITFNSLLGLSNILNNSNKVVITDNQGVLTNSLIDVSQLQRISTISNSSNRVIITDNLGLINVGDITYQMIAGLSNINNPNCFITTDNNGFLTITNITSSNINNLNNVLLNFRFLNSNITANSNLIINGNISIRDNLTSSNIFVNNFLNINSSTIRYNSLNNSLEYNYLNCNLWRQFAENTQNQISEYPPQPLNISSTILNIPRNEAIYTLSLASSSLYGNGSYILKTSIQDNINPNNLFSTDTINNFWRTDTNFSSTGIITTKYIEENSLNYPNTSNGAYISLTIPDSIILTHYVIYYNDVRNYNNTIRNFRLFGFNSTNNFWDLLDDEINITNWRFNNQPNIFRINNFFNNRRYDTFALCINRINTNTNNFAIINSIEFYGINSYYGNTIYQLQQQNQLILSSDNVNVGINNINPQSSLSIGNDIFNTTRINNATLNINNSCNIDIFNNSVNIINITRPSNSNIKGIRTSHLLGTVNNNITRYDINLSHSNYDNDINVLSLMSDGRIFLNGINAPPSIINPSLNILSNINIFNNRLSTSFIGLGVNNINSNYNIILPSSSGSLNDLLFINSISTSNLNTSWISPNNLLLTIRNVKIGYNSVLTCNVEPIKLQVAGSCLIGSNSLNTISRDFINNYSLIVAGQVYATQDITTDCDITYKHALRIIKNPLNKINSLNGYTFLRYDAVDKNKRYCGLIAQEVEKVLPEAIEIKHDGKLRINYNSLACLYIEAFKEQQKEIKNLKRIMLLGGIVFLIFSYHKYINI